MSSYKDLDVWKKSMELCELIYKATESFPKNETFGLISQMRRSSISIPSNIAEGQKRRSKKDFTHFLHISYGSGAELETQVELALRLHYLNITSFNGINITLQATMSMLNKLIRALSNDKRSTIND